MSDTSPTSGHSDPTVRVSTGTLRGAETDGIRRFLAIPYAAPPFGEDRFALPRPPEAWDGERDATAFGPTAPQHPYFGATGELLGSIEIPGEDILTVNVWTPSEIPDGGLPVMVWYHGGALERGTPALPAYDGATFARDGIVFVSVAYRLGAEGFSVLEGVPRNLGLCDAAAALTWIRREVAAFGGDPDRITISGESAGGAVVAALLVRPDTATIPAGAIIQSGPLRAEKPRRAARVSDALAKRCGVPATRDGFRSVTPTALLDARRALSAGRSPLGGTPSYQLAIDPDTLPASPDQALVHSCVPLLIGTNTDEYRLWFTPASLAKIGRLALLAVRVAMKIPGRAVRAYRAQFADANRGEIAGQLITDSILRAPAVEAASRRSTATWMYEFAWPSPVRDLRAAHALEIGFVFDHLGTGEALAMAGENAPQELADRMHADWVRFIRTGTPGWQPFDDARLVQVYNVTSAVRPLPRSGALDALRRR